MITRQSRFIVRVEGCASIAYFQCDNGECVSLFHVCDGKAHCLDASDERNCTSVTMGVNSLPKTVTRQRRDCDLNPGPSAPESSTLTTRLPSHRHYDTVLICSTPVSVCLSASISPKPHVESLSNISCVSPMVVVRSCFHGEICCPRLPCLFNLFIRLYYLC